MSSAQSSSNMSRNTSQSASCLDPLDGLIDFSEYEQVSYQSPSISPATSKSQFVRPAQASTGALIPPPQMLSGPSHPYGMHKQQTGIPAGSLANTMAINSAQMYGYGFSSGLVNEEYIDFNTPPQAPFNGLDMDIEYDSPSASPAFFFPEQPLQSSEFVNPNAIGGQENMSRVEAAHTSNVGRLWPGMHQKQAALAKAQHREKQQQLIQQQQRQRPVPQQPRQSRPKSTQVADPIVEEKISQLLSSMRQGSVANSEGDDASGSHSNGLAHHRMRKDEEDMDEDERLLASEEGKKLSSKERRQLRNKVSARAFRSRRKEYIGQLEGEIAQKVNENSDLRAQNRALMEENTRLSDLTRMLLSSPSFSGFLDNLSTNPAAAPAVQPQPTQVKVEQRPAESQQVRKDVNPYVAQQQLQNQQINFAMMPEQTMDFSMLDLNGEAGFIYQPQVYSVLELPEMTIDTTLLAGKTSNFVPAFENDEEKVELPLIKQIPIKEEVISRSAPVDDEFDADPAFALFAGPSTPAPANIESIPVFGSIAPEKALDRFELVDASENEEVSARTLLRIECMYRSIDAVVARLEAMTVE